MTKFKQIVNENDGTITYVKINEKDDPLEDNRTDIKKPVYQNGVCQVMPTPNDSDVKIGFWRTDNPYQS